MNENLKTLIFVAAAAAVGLIAWATMPASQTTVAEDFRNKLLYPKFTNPLDAASLEIVKFDETKGEPAVFKVAEVEHKGKARWSIPSHDNYPADARDQVASAATALMGLRVLDMVSDNKGDESVYGVVDPDPDQLSLGATGVGQRVVMQDKNGKDLLALVVGKQVPDKPNLCYVRKVGQREIYIVEAKTDKLSTKFEDWIEPNLLQINTLDLKELLIDDYSIKVTLQGGEMRGGIVQNDKMRIAYNDAADPHWKMLVDRRFVPDDKDPASGKWAPVKMTPDEELNTAKLDDLKTALDDLKIVDVSRKPAGLSADLKVAADFASHQDAQRSLASKGFYPIPVGDSGLELLSNEGEVRLEMKNGVEYVLRFGQITGTGPAAKDAKAGPKQDEKIAGLNRYLFVMAEFNPDAIPKPKLQPLPQPKKSPEPEKKPAAEKKDAKKPDAKKTDAKPVKKAPAIDPKAEQAERARIERDNKRLQEAYDQQLADGQKRVAELNARFADWYYVISDEVYRKIHLSRKEIVMKKEKAPKAAAGAMGNKNKLGIPAMPKLPPAPAAE